VLSGGSEVALLPPLSFKEDPFLSASSVLDSPPATPPRFSSSHDLSTHVDGDRGSVSEGESEDSEEEQRWRESEGSEGESEEEGSEGEEAWSEEEGDGSKLATSGGSTPSPTTRERIAAALTPLRRNRLLSGSSSTAPTADAGTITGTCND
jgi:hypothetical protein